MRHSKAFKNIYDFVIVGSGFGGSVAAMRLAEKGYSVIVIERGKKYESKDFPRSNWNLKKYLWIPALKFFGFQKLTFTRNAIILSGMGVGGGSLVYANTLQKPPSAFFNNPQWNSFNDWEKILSPFFDKASFMLGRAKYEKQNFEDLALLDVARDMDREDSYDNVNVGVYLGDSDEEVDPYFKGLGPLRKACTECGGCMVGCSENSKNSLDKNYLYFASKYGAEILPETTVQKIEKNEDLYSVSFQATGTWIKKKKATIKTKGIIISGGTLGSLKLLLKQKYKYRTLPDLSDTLGQNVLTNSQTLSCVTRSKDKMNNGVAISSVFKPNDVTNVEIVKYPEGSNAMQIFFSMATGKGGPFIRTLKLIGNIFSHPIKFIKVLFNFKWANNTIIFLIMQTLDNSMKIIWKRGLFRKRMKIQNSGFKKVPAYIDIGQEVLYRYAKKVNGIPLNIITEILFNIPTTAHILGGCTMGENSIEGVIDKNFEVFGYPGMYILDGSVVQGNIGVNPAFTITALSEYAIHLIPEKSGNTNKTLKEQIKRRIN